MCMFLFFGFISLLFLLKFYSVLFFVCWGGGGCSVSVGPSPPSILCLTYSTGRGLCFASTYYCTVLLMCGEEASLLTCGLVLPLSPAAGGSLRAHGHHAGQ